MKKRLGIFLRSTKKVFRQKFFYVTTGISIVFLFLSLFLIWWRLFPEITHQLAIPLHYNTHFGVDLFGSWWKIFIVPIMQISVIILNIIISIIVLRKDKVLSNLVLSGSVLVNILLFISMIFIVLLNLSYYG